MRRHLSALLGCVVMVTAGVAAGCSESEPPGSIVWPHPAGSSASVTTTDVVPGAPVTLGNLVICVEGAPSGEILDVRAADGSPVRVSAFTVRPQDAHELFGGDRIALEDTGIPVAEATVETSCGESLGTELIIEVRSASDEVAVSPEIVVEYQVSDATGTLSIPFGIALCPPEAAVCEM